jgi:hypothetical protein
VWILLKLTCSNVLLLNVQPNNAGKQFNDRTTQVLLCLLFLIIQWAAFIWYVSFAPYDLIIFLMRVIRLLILGLCLFEQAEFSLVLVTNTAFSIVPLHYFQVLSIVHSICQKYLQGLPPRNLRGLKPIKIPASACFSLHFALHTQMRKPLKESPRLNSKGEESGCVLY